MKPKPISAILLAMTALVPLPQASAAPATTTKTTPMQNSPSVTRNGSQPSQPTPAEYFTGAVRVSLLPAPVEPSRLGGASVAFEAGVRTNWHTHPLGQTLIVTQGVGRVQE